MIWLQTDDKELSYSTNQASAVIEDFTTGFVKISAMSLDGEEPK
jgi:hypothetical protein